MNLFRHVAAMLAVFLLIACVSCIGCGQGFTLTGYTGTLVGSVGSDKIELRLDDGRQLIFPSTPREAAKARSYAGSRATLAPFAGSWFIHLKGN